MSDRERALALAPPRALGEPVARGWLRARPEDFVVEEDLGFAPSGNGPHLLLKVRKRNANTEWVARQIAAVAGCRPFDVGFAGLKDRRAVAVQWFSVPAPRTGSAALASLEEEEFAVLEAHPHSRKLPRGALAGNRFEIRIRELVAGQELEQRLLAIASGGVPNYFGPQRFGRDGANLERIGGPLHPGERGFVLSAARSLVFNAVLAERVRLGSWYSLEAGDIANLDARGSIFAVDAVDDVLRDRAARLEIHVTGPMWGQGDLPTTGQVRELEARVAASFPRACELVREAGMKQERRALRLAVRELRWEREGEDLQLGFRLARGSFATTVLREILADTSDGDE
jgi:tRNA pseudouridine13 synthase